jgi:hypothetical protein
MKFFLGVLITGLIGWLTLAPTMPPTAFKGMDRFAGVQGSVILAPRIDAQSFEGVTGSAELPADN